MPSSRYQKLPFRSRANRSLNAAVILGLWIGTAWMTVSARDYLSDVEVKAWSPNGEWLAFNWPQQDDLFFISMKSGQSYLLKPVGPVELRTADVFASGPITAATHAQTRVVPSWGLSKLTMLEWSPDNTTAAYQIGRDDWGLFSIPDTSMVKHMPASTLLPWHTQDDLSLAFDLETGTIYRLAVKKHDGTTVREVRFGDPAEVTQISLARYHEAEFLSHGKTFLLYPHRVAERWQLILEPLTGGATPRVLADLGDEQPYAWTLSEDDRSLAVATKTTLLVGTIGDWARGRKIPLDASSITMRWSPDGHLLAYNQNQSLFCLTPEGETPATISTFCTQRFWGWRGRRLLFGDSRTSRTNVYAWDSGKGGDAIQVVSSRHWQSSPRMMSISPDGETLVCAIAELDGSGHSVSQLWKTTLHPDGQWEMLCQPPQ